MASRRATTSSLAKRHASASENLSKAFAPAGALKKRPALANITNQRQPSASAPGYAFDSSKIAPCSGKLVTIKKVPSTSSNARSSGAGAILTSNCATKHTVSVIPVAASVPRNDGVIPGSSAMACSSGMEASLNHSDSSSSSMDESTSSCDSLRSPEVEYMDGCEIEAVDLIEKKTSSMIFISENLGTPAGSLCKRDILASGESCDQIICLDDNLDDPQLCAAIACDIYKHLRASEAKKRSATNFMERIQKDINASMRGILVDWLVEVAEEYRLVPDTLYLTVNYIDRYLSGNPMDRQKLQLLGVACMMIAAKYEEICAPQVEEFCYITDNTYFKDEVLQMESCVLNYLKFEMTAPTTKCFLRRFVRAAQGADETPVLLLECLANYIAELSLLEYSMLRFAPSLIAASSIFLAKFILLPSKRPWNRTLNHYTLYTPHDLRDCVSALHGLVCNNPNSTPPAIREKYSQHKYKFVAKKYCPPSIPQEYFINVDN